MKTTIKKISVVILAGAMTASCATGGGAKEDFGKIAGGVLGGVIGAKATKKKHRVAGVIFGGFLGGYIGGRIGASLDAKDKAALSRKIRQSAASNRPVTWRSNHSKSSATVTPVQTVRREKMGKVTVRPVVQAPKRKTTTNLVVKKGPSNSSSNQVVFSKEEELAILALTKDGNWAQVRNRRGQTGYVRKDELARKTKSSRGAKSRVKNEANARGGRVQNEPPIRVSRATIEAPAMVSVACRKVKVRSKINGSIVEEYVETCQAPDGSWGA